MASTDRVSYTVALCDNFETIQIPSSRGKLLSDGGISLKLRVKMSESRRENYLRELDEADVPHDALTRKQLWEFSDEQFVTIYPGELISCMTFLGKSDPLPPFGPENYVWLEGVIPCALGFTSCRRYLHRVTFHFLNMLADEVLEHYIPTL